MAAPIYYPDTTFRNEGGGNQFVDTSIVAENVVIGNYSQDEEEERLLAKLPCAAEATIHHYSRQGESLCMADTRTQVLNQIMAWARGESSDSSVGGGSPRIYWLSGMAGTGKSTIARTIARACLDDDRLGASFFFSRGGGERETARAFVTTIAVQLARLTQRQRPSRRALRAAICDAVREQPDIAQHALLDQWKRLVLRPCKWMRAEMEGDANTDADVETAPDAPPGAPPLVIVVDALDECHSADEIAFLLALLSQTSGLAVAALRILVTSRPEIPIREGLLGMPDSARRHLVLHHIDASVVGRDIRIFFERSLTEVIRHGPLLPGIPDDVVLRQLEERAGGLFVWAATACRFIKEGGPIARRRLHMIIQGQQLSSGLHLEHKLDEIYTGILRNAVPVNVTEDESEAFCDLVRTVLGTLAVLFSSLSVPSLASLVCLPEHEVFDALRDLHSMIDVLQNPYEPIRLQHASVRDFLLDNGRCSDARFRVNKLDAHAHLANRCLRFMNNRLTKNICRLQGPGVLTKTISRAVIDDSVPLPLRYACLYWVQHIQSGQNPQTLRGSVDSFMRVHFLHWLEVLGLIGRMTEAAEMVTLLGTLYDPSTRLPRMIADAKRFILANRHMIGEAPLQAYISALAFAPSKSVIRQAYENALPQWLTQPPRMQDDWSNEFLCLGGHSRGIAAVAFSPDKQLLASGSEDGTVRLWDITTGAARGTLEGHTDSVWAAQFSPDGQLLATGSSDSTVRLWSAKTGAACGVLEGHSSYVQSLAFSPNALLLASADSTIMLWSTESGASRGTLEGHAWGVRCLTFLPDGRSLASLAKDGTVKFWNIRTMLVDRTVELLGPSYWLQVVALSSDGKLVALGSSDGITLWNTTTGAKMSSFPDYATALTFSQNGEILVHAGYDGVTIRDLKTEERFRMLNGNEATTVSFSPDEIVIAVGLSDHSIRLLDVNLGTAPAACDCELPPIVSLKFSADGSHLASGLSHGTVNLLKAETGALLATWKGEEVEIFGAPISFSPDGTLLAFASSPSRLKLINVHDRAASVTMRSDSGFIRDVVFSPNGKIIAAAAGDNIRLWTIETGAQWPIRWGHYEARAVTFSPTGDMLASSADNRTIKLWHIDGEEERAILEVRTYHVTYLSFSPDGTLLASASWRPDSDIQIWSSHTCDVLYTIRGIPGIRWLKFSPNSRILTTNIGAHRLPLLSSCAPAADVLADPSYALSLTDEWLTCDLENLLWIPPQCRTWVVATCGEAIALGLNSGEVIAMSFDFSRGRPWEDMTSRSAPNRGAEEPSLDPPEDNAPNPGAEEPSPDPPEDNPPNPGAEEPSLEPLKDNAPYPGAEEPSPDPPENNPSNPGAEEPLPQSLNDNAAPAQMRQHRRAWRALKRFLKSPARSAGEP